MNPHTTPRSNINRPDANRATSPSAKPSSAFAKSREAAQAAVQGLAFYSSEAKEKLFNDMTPLWLHAVEVKTGAFGEQWYLTVSENSAAEDHGTIALARNNYRDTLFGALAENLISTGHASIGPLMLSKITTRAGQESWDLIEWTQGDLES